MNILKAIKLFLILFTLIIFVSLAKDTYAQGSCAGNHTFNWTINTCQFNPVTSTYSCSGSPGSSNQICSRAACEACVTQRASACTANASGCVINDRFTCDSSSCSTGGPGPTAPPSSVCGNGLCESGESNATCPSDCSPASTPPPPPPGGGCTSGSPFGPPQPANCGAVGKDPGSGSCGAGCICCKDKTGPASTCATIASNPTSLTLAPGETKPLVVGVWTYLGNPWVMFDLGAISNNTVIAKVTPNVTALCCSTAYGPYTNTLNVTGLVPGNTTVYARYRLDNAGTKIQCDGYTSVRVTVPVPPPPPPGKCETPVVTGVPQCSLTAGGSVSVTFQWPYVQNSDRYSFSVVDAVTGVVVAGTDTGFIPANSAAFNFCNGLGTTCTHTVNLPEGVTNYQGNVIGRSSAALCADSDTGVSNAFQVSRCIVNAWWQGGNGDVITTQGTVGSTIPDTVVSPNNRLVQDGSGGYPGILMMPTTGNVDSGTGVVSRPEWNIKSAFSGRVPAFNDFVDLIPSSVTPTDPNGSGNSAPGSALLTAGADSNGYSWYRHTGDLTITSDVDISGANANKKVVLFVTGNLTIRGKINISNINTGFFMALAGKNGSGIGGDISVDPTISTTGVIPTISGVFYCEGKFKTGTGGSSTDGKLNVLGSVSALGGVTLERDLGPGNSTDPAESFTSSPALFLNYPPALTFKRPVWREIAP